MKCYRCRVERENLEFDPRCEGYYCSNCIKEHVCSPVGSKIESPYDDKGRVKPLATLGGIKLSEPGTHRSYNVFGIGFLTAGLLFFVIMSIAFIPDYLVTRNKVESLERTLTEVKESIREIKTEVKESNRILSEGRLNGNR